MSKKSIELEPTKENLLEAIAEDLIERNELVWNLVMLCNDQNDNYSVAIDGKWGSGKTFFIKQAQMLIESANPYDKKYTDIEKENICAAFEKYTTGGEKVSDCIINQVCVYYDAWMNDNDIDPLLSLVYSILQQTGSSFVYERDTDVLDIAASIIDILIARNVTKLIEKIRNKDILTDIRETKDLYTLTNKFFDSILEEHGDRLVVFIDELDRCKPTFAIQLLERVKHYFSNDRITFIFAINTVELQHTVKRYYGESFDACRYLDRFFDNRASLSSPNLAKYHQKHGIYIGPSSFQYICKKIITQYNFSLREIGRFTHMMKSIEKEARIFRDYSGFGEDNARRFAFIIIVPIIIGLRMYNTSLYNDFIEGKNCTPLIEIVGDGEDVIGICNLLLDKLESYEDTGGNQCTVISLKERLKTAYEALFIEDLNYPNKECTVGQCIFRSVIRKEVLNAASML